jgi:hypothetical protein
LGFLSLPALLSKYFTLQHGDLEFIILKMLRYE